MQGFLIVFFLFLSRLVLAQQAEDMRPKNNLGINFFGEASLISLYYERVRFFHSTRLLALKGGVGYHEEFKICLGPCPSPKQFLTIPHHVGINWGKGRHFFEMGAGGTFFTNDAKLPYIVYGTLAYRVQPHYVFIA